MANSWWRGEPAPANPWRALTLEWQVTSPPPIFNFDEPPQIVGSPYAYGVPGARHAIVTVHAPPQPEELPVPVALAVASREEREAIMSALKHILVVANQTVTGDRLIAALRSRAATDPVRVTVICPQNDPTDAWVVDEADVRAATQARLDGTLADAPARRDRGQRLRGRARPLYGGDGRRRGGPAVRDRRLDAAADSLRLAAP